MTSFSEFENVAWMMSWRPFCMFLNAALSWLQCCNDIASKKQTALQKNCGSLYCRKLPTDFADFYETFYRWSGGYLPVTFFSDFENSKWLTSWRPFCMFFNAALSRSQFCSDFLQNWAQGTKLSSNVCYWKSAKSVGSFWKYREPRFRKKSKWPPKINFLKSGKWGVNFH